MFCRLFIPLWCSDTKTVLPVSLVTVFVVPFVSPASKFSDKGPTTKVSCVIGFTLQCNAMQLKTNKSQVHYAHQIWWVKVDQLSHSIYRPVMHS